jgi:hypothetical protein
MKKLMLICLLLFSFRSFSQTSIHARLDTAKAVVGQTIHLNIKVVQSEATRITWPLLNDSIGGVDVINSENPDTQKTSGNQLLISKRIQLMAFDSGNFIIPSLSFIVEDKAGKKELQTDPLKLEVFYVPVDTTKEIKDIAPIVEVPYDWKYIISIVAMLLLIALAAWFIYKKYFKNRKKPEVVIPEIKRPFHEIALEELDALAKAGLWQQGKVKEYYTELTDILRRYITSRWNLNAMELTSDEILSAGFIHLLQAENKMQLEFVLRNADLVKFAKLLPLPNDHENALKFSIALVKSSIPAVSVDVSKEEVKS